MNIKRNGEVILHKNSAGYYEYDDGVFTRIRRSLEDIPNLPKHGITSYSKYKKGKVVVKIYTTKTGFCEVISGERFNFDSPEIIKDMYKLHEYYISNNFKQVV